MLDAIEAMLKFLREADADEIRRFIALLSRPPAEETGEVNEYAARWQRIAAKWHRLVEAIATNLSVDPTGSADELGQGIADAIELLRRPPTAPASPAAEVAEMSPRVAALILKARDAHREGDYNETYHRLYEIAAPKFDKHIDEVWKDVERIAASEASRDGAE